MTQITISYHKYNNQLGQCQIELPSENLPELRSHFQHFLGAELAQGETISKGDITILKFQASKAKIQILQEIIQITQGITARLN